jgi:hypothetical protein
MPTYAIVISTASKMIRRVIADDDGQVSIGLMPDGITPAVLCAHPSGPTSYHPMATGETGFIVPVSGTGPGSNPPAWSAAVQAKYGVTPPVISCAIIDTNNIVQLVILADPAVDAAPAGFTMVQCYSPAITVNCTYVPGTGKFLTAGGSIPPGAPGNAQGVTTLIVAPAVI